MVPAIRLYFSSSMAVLARLGFQCRSLLKLDRGTDSAEKSEL